MKMIYHFETRKPAANHLSQNLSKSMFFSTLKTKNKWLYPEDNFGVLERGKAWSKD